MFGNGRIEVQVEAGTARLQGTLTMPEGTNGLVLFAHGSGSGRLSSRNRFVASYLNDRQLGTLLFDLLTPDEEAIDARTGELRFNIALLSARLTATVDWVSQQARLTGARLGLFGASTGAAGALYTAAQRPELIHAVVSRGGRPDLADGVLSRVIAPTLLIVGGNDDLILELNRKAVPRMRAPHELRTIFGATHLFEEPGALEQAAELAAAWFLTYLNAAKKTEASSPAELH